MSNDKIYDLLLAYITENGETGVNVLARHCDIPLSTMQRYLERQTYFRKTISRKWDIPSKVETDIKSNSMTLMVDSVENALLLLNSQMDEIQQSIQNSLLPLNSLKRAVINLNTPVANASREISANIHPRLLEMDKKSKENDVVFKKYKDKIPEEYKDLIMNTDLLLMSIELGTKFVKGTVIPEISALLLEETDKLSDDVMDVLSEYQKGE